MRSLKSIGRRGRSRDYANREREISMGEAAKVELEQLFFPSITSRDERELIRVARSRMENDKYGKLRRIDL